MPLDLKEGRRTPCRGLKLCHTLLYNNCISLSGLQCQQQHPCHIQHPYLKPCAVHSCLHFTLAVITVRMSFCIRAIALSQMKTLHTFISHHIFFFLCLTLFNEHSRDSCICYSCCCALTPVLPRYWFTYTDDDTGTLIHAS